MHIVVVLLALGSGVLSDDKISEESDRQTQSQLELCAFPQQITGHDVGSHDLRMWLQSRVEWLRKNPEKESEWSQSEVDVVRRILKEREMSLN
jgi:hypothetical protein